MGDPLAPPGWRLRADEEVRSLDGGTVLVGGSPWRLLRLSDAGARQVARWWAGEPVADSPAARTLARRLLDIGMAHPVLAAAEPTGSVSAEVTVVVPVRDRSAELSRCLAGLAGGNGSADASGSAGGRVIVVDDGSADPGAVAAIAAAAGARYLRRPISGGPAAARNTGLAAADTPLVAFIDSDCVPGPHWLAPLLPHFADPAVAAVAPRITAHDTGQAGWLARYETAASALDMGPAESVVRPGAKVPYLPSAALVVRRAAAGAGFAEDMPVGEDVDFMWRLAAGGWTVRYEPKAAVAHQHRLTPGAWFARRIDYGTSAAPLELRHPGSLAAVSISGWSAVAWAAAVVGYPEAGVAVLLTVTALLARRLVAVTDDPWPVAALLAAGGTLGAGHLIGSALSRAWWPVAVPAVLAVPRLRLPLATLTVAAPLWDWYRRRPPVGPVGYTTAKLCDDLGYSVGVWRGCLRGRTARPLLPRLWWRSGAGSGSSQGGSC